MAKKREVIWDDGQPRQCAVVESLGYVHDIGAHACQVSFEGRERMAVKQAGQWRVWTARDRLSGGFASRGVGQ